MDMAAFELGDVFRLAIVPFRAFHHLTLPNQQRQALVCINRSLVAGGHLLIDLLDPLLDYCVPGAPPPVPERQIEDSVTGHIVIRRVTERINDPVHQMFTERFRIEELDKHGRSVVLPRFQATSWSL
jgi:hypothetical protein